LADGSQLEIVRISSDPDHPQLLHWDGNHATVAEEISVKGRRYVPAESNAGPWRHMRLPSGVVPYGSTKGLFDEVLSMVAKYSGLGGDHAALVTYLALASHFVDCLQTAPCAVLHGAEAEALALLRLLTWFCRRPVLLSDGGLRMPEYLAPTRLICQPHTSLKKLMPALQFPGFAVSAGPSLRDISGATVIYAGGGELETPFIDCCLEIPVAPTGRVVSGFDELRESAAIEQLQNKLLSYRLANRDRVKLSDFDVPEFSGAIRVLARSLGACIVDAPDLQAALVPKLRGQDEALRLDRGGIIQGAVLQALLVCCHERRPSGYVSDVAKLTNAILSQEGEHLTLTPRQVGGALKAIGFQTTRLDSGGRGLYFVKETCQQVHTLGKSYHLPLFRKGLPGCPFCREQTAPADQ
jgi:hypothetical protein